jgi:hypothetical protein
MIDISATPHDRRGVVFSTLSDSPTLDDQAALLTPERTSTSDRIELMDAALGLAVLAVAASRQAAVRASFVVRPIGAVARVPFWLGRRVLGDHRANALRARGSAERQHAVTAVSRLIDRLTPRLVEAVLARVDATDLVLRHVDLDTLVRHVELDEVVAQVDLQAVIDRVDVDAIVARADLQAVIDRVDVDAVMARADLQAVIDRVDVDAIVARADLQAVLDRVDVDQVMSRADLDAVIARIDLIRLAEYVVEGIDLPGIIRSSTGSMASEGLLEVRRQGIRADERVAHAVDRLLRRADRTAASPLETDTTSPLPMTPDGQGPTPAVGHGAVH